MQQMDQRIKVYNESLGEKCEPGDGASPDDGLFIDVSCEFQCADLVQKIERVRGAFIPKNQGLFPGNGSNETNTLWSSVGVSMKTWAERICLEKAAAGCKGIQSVTKSELKEIESGAWKLNRFPGCKETSITLSPFNDSIRSNRIPKVASLLEPEDKIANQKNFELQVSGLALSVPLADFNQTKTKCQKTIKASLCFGDCIDLNAESSSDFIETLGTKEPLGFDQVEICADDLSAKLASQNAPVSVKQQVCEAYFWESLIKSPGMMKSCAAIRGDVDCGTI